MKFYAHSINYSSLLVDVDLDIGVEIDVRDSNGKLVLGHDPLGDNYEDLEYFLKNLKGRSVIANIKSERLEKPFISSLNKYSSSSDYFFLDSSFSVIANNGKNYNFASRFSEYESLNTSISLINASLVKWIWIDTFTKLPLNEKNVKTLNLLNAKKCLTSPDLLGRVKDIKIYAKIIKDLGLSLDAICCKKENIVLWKSFLE